MVTVWYCKIDGTVFGPLAPHDLKRMAETGRLRSTDLVKNTATGKWVPANHVKGLNFNVALETFPNPVPIAFDHVKPAGLPPEHIVDAVVLQPENRGRSHFSSSMVGQIRVVAILMIVQGVLEFLTGSLFLLMGPFIMAVEQGKRKPNDPPPELMLVAGVGLALLLWTIATLRIIAGIKNLNYRGRTLGIVALSMGALTLCTVYCAPTAIALLIYGLIVYTKEDVIHAFAGEMAGGIGTRAVP